MLWLVFLTLLKIGGAVEVEIATGIDNGATAALPLLRLPYATYQANSYDVANDIYVFANIRFAAAPTGTLRWREPAPPPIQTGIQNGSYGGTCCQPTQDAGIGGQAHDYEGLEFQDTPHVETPQKKHILPRPKVPLQFPMQEDCLFLDVYVPGAALNAAPPNLFPVLFWIYGGGYVHGSKDEYSGTSLIKMSNNSIIYVQTNYRLGAFGFLAGSRFIQQGGVANVGLLDQDAALNWTQRYISLVGGNPQNITVMGESAGAGSIMHHLTARGGATTPVFNKAILQSTAFVPQYNISRLDGQYIDFVDSSQCGGTTPELGCLRLQTSSILQTANEEEISKAPYGQFQYGPAIDGTYVPDLPGRELLFGKFSKGIQLMIGHNSDEGFIFADPLIETNDAVDDWIQTTFPDAKPSVINTITNTLYPPAPTSRYWFPFTRLVSLISDGVLNCNSLYLARAYLNQTYNYKWDVDPGYHGLDLCYTFFPIDIVVDGVDVCVLYPLGYRAQQFQQYLVSFVMYGTPNTAKAPPTPQWPWFGYDKNFVDITYVEDFFLSAPDDQLPDDLCGFWQPAPYIG